MNNFEDLDKMVEFHIKYRLGDKIVLYHNTESVTQLDKFISSLSQNSVSKEYTFIANPLHPTKVHCLIRYFNIDIIIINVDDL